MIVTVLTYVLTTFTALLLARSAVYIEVCKDYLKEIHKANINYINSPSTPPDSLQDE